MEKLISGFEHLMVVIAFAEAGEILVQPDELTRHMLLNEKGGVS